MRLFLPSQSKRATAATTVARLALVPSDPVAFSHLVACGLTLTFTFLRLGPGSASGSGHCITGMTSDPAYASFTDDILGSISPGKFADFVVLSQDIMTIAPRKVLGTHVVATVIDGRPVYGAI